MDITCLGEILIDMFPAELGRKIADISAFLPTPGGAPANVAVAAARLGRQSAFIGKVGDDAFGRHLADVLAQAGVDTRGLRFDSQARTTLAFIALPDPNHPEFVFYRNPGADLLLTPEEVDRAVLASTGAFHCGSLSLTAEPARSATYAAIKLARRGGALISYDVNYRPSLWSSPQQALEQIWSMLPQADLVKVNEVELELLTGSRDIQTGATALLKSGPALVVVTLGADGSYYYAAHAQGFVPAFAVDTVDAVGCGDAFMAGLLCRLVENGPWRDKLNNSDLSAAFRFASAVGAITATRRGVIPALPTAAEVEQFLLARSKEN